MHRYSSWAILGLTLSGAVLAVNACSATDDNGSSTTQGPTTAGPGGAGGATSATGTGGSISVGSAVGGGSCDSGNADDDKDGDGFTENENDCNDCDEFVNPDAVEVIAEPGDAGTPAPGDEDCDGTKDNVAPPCDTGLPLDSLDAMDAAKAIGLCKYVESATWVAADGSPPPSDPTQLANFHKGHGNLPHLGPNNAPREGDAILSLSSGIARNAGDPAFTEPGGSVRNFNKGYSGNSPFGFPKESQSCPGSLTGPPNDATGVQFEIKAPSNAQGYSFDFNFFTHEWPQYICKEFNDFFVAIMEPFPQGQTDGNISFDMLGNPISVNNAFLDICSCPAGPPCNVPPTPPTVKTFDCASGTAGLVGTNFATDTTPGWSTGSSGWLRTTAPVAPGETFTIRLVTYDSADHNVDSTTLIDNFKWQAKPGTVGTVVVPD